MFASPLGRTMSTRYNSRSLLKLRVTEPDRRSTSRDRKIDEKFHRDPPQQASRLRSRSARSQVRENDSSLTGHSPKSSSRNRQNLYDRNKRSQSQCGPKLKRSCSQASHSSGSSLDRKPYQDKEEEKRHQGRDRSRAKPFPSIGTRPCSNEAASVQSKNEEKPDLRSFLNKRRGSSSDISDSRKISDDSSHLSHVDLIPPQFPYLRERLLPYQLKDIDKKKKHSSRQSDKPHTATSNISETDQNNTTIHCDLVSNCANKIPVVVGIFCQDTTVDSVVTNESVSLCQQSGSSEYQENTVETIEEIEGLDECQENTVETFYQVSPYEETKFFGYQENIVTEKDQVFPYQGSSEYQENTASTNTQVSLYQEKGHNDHQENTVAINDIVSLYQETGNIDQQENTAGTNGQVCLYQGGENNEYQENTVDTKNQGAENIDHQKNTTGTHAQVCLYQGGENNEYQENNVDTKNQGAENIDHQKNTAGTHAQVCLYQGKGHDEHQENTVDTGNQVSPLPVHSEIRDTDNQENAGNSAHPEAHGDSEYQENVSHFENSIAEFQNNYDWKSDYERLDEYIRVNIEGQECATQQETESSPVAQKEVACTGVQSDSDYRSGPDEHTRMESAAQQEMGSFPNAPVDESCTPKMYVHSDDLPAHDSTQDVVGLSMMQSEPDLCKFNNESVPILLNKADNMIQTDSRETLNDPIPLRSTNTVIRNDAVETEILNYTTLMANASSTNEETHPDGYDNSTGVTTALDMISSMYTENDDVDHAPAMDLLESKKAVARFEKNTKMIVNEIQKAEICPDVKESKNTKITTMQNKAKPNFKDTRMITSSMKNVNVNDVTNSSLWKRRLSSLNIRAAEQTHMSNSGPTIVNVYKAAESVDKAETPIWEYRHSNQFNENRGGRTNENICNAVESGAALMKIVCHTNENTYKVVETVKVQTPNWDYRRSNQTIEFGANWDKGRTNENVYKTVEPAEVQIPIWDSKNLNENVLKAVEPAVVCRTQIPIWKSFNENVYKAPESDAEYILLDLDSLHNQDQRPRNSGPIESYGWSGQRNNPTNDRQTYGHFETTSRQDQYMRCEVASGCNTAGNRCKSTQPNFTNTNQTELLPNLTHETRIVPYVEQLSATRETDKDQSYNEPIKVSNDPRSAVNISRQPVRYPQIEYPLPAFNFGSIPPPPPPPPPSPVPPPSPAHYARPSLYPYNPHLTPASNFQAWGRSYNRNNPPTPASKNWNRNNQGYNRTNVQYNTKRYYNNDFPSGKRATAASVMDQSNNLDLLHEVERREQLNYGFNGDKMPSFLTNAAQSTLNKDKEFQPRQLGQLAHEPEQDVGKSLPCPLQQQQENSSETLPEEQAIKPQKVNKASKSTIKKTKDSTTNKNKFKKLLQIHTTSQTGNRKIPTQLQFIYDRSMKNKLPNVKIPKIPKPKKDETTQKVDTEAQGTSTTEPPLLQEESTGVQVDEDTSTKVKDKRKPKFSKKCSASETSSDTPCTKKPRKEVFDTVSVDNILQEVSSERRMPNTRSRRRAIESSKQQNDKKAVTFSEPLELEDSRKVLHQPVDSETETASSNQVESSQLCKSAANKLNHNTLQVKLAKVPMPTAKEGETLETSNETIGSTIIHAETSNPTAHETIDETEEIIPAVTHAEFLMPTMTHESEFIASNETDSSPSITLAQTSKSTANHSEDAGASNETDSSPITHAQTSSVPNVGETETIQIDSSTIAHAQNLISAINEYANIQATSSSETEFSPQDIEDTVSATFDILPDGVLNIARQAMQKLRKPAQKCKALLELVTVVKAQQNQNEVCHKYCEDTECFLKNSIETLIAAEGFPDEEAKLLKMISRAALRNIAIIILFATTPT